MSDPRIDVTVKPVGSLWEVLIEPVVNGERVSEITVVLDDITDLDARLEEIAAGYPGARIVRYRGR